MPDFELTWEAHGTAKVEADDLTDARQILSEAVAGWDSTMLEEVDTLGVHITDGIDHSAE